MSFFYKEQERVRNEIKAWRPYNTLAVNYMLTDTRTPICPWPYRQRLTVSAGADVEKAGLSTWTEALIGRIICTAGKKSLRSHEAVHGNPARYTWPLVHQLHGPEFGQRALRNRTVIQILLWHGLSEYSILIGWQVLIKFV